MIMQIQAPRQRTGRRATDARSKASASLYKSIPDRVYHVPHPEYLSPQAENELFGPEAPAISVSHWRPASELEDGQEMAELPPARSNLSRQDEALLFKRYNCARYHLAGLMEKQARRFAGSRVREILTWYRRVLDNRAALTGANMALVVAMAKRTRITSVEFPELVSEGNMALLRAVDKFDFSRGFKFSTYACSAILKSFSRLATVSGTYRQRFSTNFEQERERGNGLDRKSADHHELDIEDLRQAMVLNRAGLTDVERTVLGARYALEGRDHVHSLREVSRLVQLSAERVRQVQNLALTKLRQALEKTFSSAAASLGDNEDAFEDLATTVPGRPGPGVPTAAYY